MTENPHDKILDPEFFKILVREHFADTIELVSDLVAYGTHLVLRSYASGDGKVKDIVLAVVMLKQSVSLADSIVILSRNAAPSHGFTLLRSLWEMNVYIEWILKRDTVERATMYYVFEVREQLRWASVAKAGSIEARQHLLNMHDAPEGATSREFDQVEVARAIEILHAKLNSPECKEINARFDELQMKNGRRIRSWYAPAGRRNIRELAHDVAMEAEYHTLYSGYCKATHGQVFEQHARFENDQVVFEHIRNAVNLDRLLRSTIIYLVRIYSAMLNAYRPEEMRLFNKKYVNEWMDRIHKIPDVKYKDGNYTFERRSKNEPI